jgi:hypothetical protein
MSATRLATKPTRIAESENRKKKLDPTSPNCLGVSSSSCMIGTAARPTTALSAKLSSMQRNKRPVIVHALRRSFCSHRAFPRQEQRHEGDGKRPFASLTPPVLTTARRGLPGKDFREALEARLPPNAGTGARLGRGEARVSERDARSLIQGLQQISHSRWGARSAGPVQVCTSFRGGSISRNSPSRANSCPLTSPEARQRPPTRTSPAHFVVRKTPGRTHQSTISSEARARKTRSGAAPISTLARTQPSERSATARARLLSMLLIFSPGYALIARDWTAKRLDSLRASRPRSAAARGRPCIHARVRPEC